MCYRQRTGLIILSANEIGIDCSFVEEAKKLFDKRRSKSIPQNVYNLMSSEARRLVLLMLYNEQVAEVQKAVSVLKERYKLAS